VRVTRDYLESRRAALLDQLRQVERDIEGLKPDEPASGLIQFVKRYNGSGGSKLYHFAAIRTPEGRWYVTGSTTHSTRPMSWDELLEFIRLENMPAYHWFREASIEREQVLV
jgi:hypothetical protein